MTNPPHRAPVKKDGYEGLQMTFRDSYFDRLDLQTRPVILLSWAVRSLGGW